MYYKRYKQSVYSISDTARKALSKAGFNSLQKKKERQTMTHNCTGHEANDIYEKYWAAQSHKEGIDPLSIFIGAMRGLGYPAMSASLMYNLIQKAHDEIKKKMREDVNEVLMRKD